MPTTHLLSLHPVHADAMLNGAKTIEWRRRWPKIIVPGDRLVIYATSPTSAIVGEVTMVEAHREHPDHLWGTFANEGFVDEALFRGYMGTLTSVVAVQVKNPKRWASPLPLNRLKALQNQTFHPPQTTARIEDKTIERLEQWARWDAFGQGRSAWEQPQGGNIVLSADTVAWIGDTLRQKPLGEYAAPKWWSSIVRELQVPLGVKINRPSPSTSRPEYVPMVLFINQEGSLDLHGRPLRQRAGFMVLKKPSYPQTYDDNGDPVGERGIVAWHLDPCAMAQGWTRHMVAVAMHELNTLTPTWVIPAGHQDECLPLIEAMRWSSITKPDGHVYANIAVVRSSRSKNGRA